MAILTPTLTLTANANSASTSPGLASDALSLSVTDSLTIVGPSAGISRLGTGANPLGAGVGILITEALATVTTYIYIKHLGVLASDGTTACHASNANKCRWRSKLYKNATRRICFFSIVRI